MYDDSFVYVLIPQLQTDPFRFVLLISVAYVPIRNIYFVLLIIISSYTLNIE